MKNLKTIAFALLVVLGTTTTIAQNKKINVEKSKINWVGKKVTGEHSGTINVKNGALVFKKAKLVLAISTCIFCFMIDFSGYATIKEGEPGPFAIKATKDEITNDALL